MDCDCVLATPRISCTEITNFDLALPDVNYLYLFDNLYLRGKIDPAACFLSGNRIYPNVCPARLG